MGQQRKSLSPETSPWHSLGAALREQRDSAGLSLAQLGRAVFYDSSHLGKFERAHRHPPRNVITACDQVLNARGTLIELWQHAATQQSPAIHAAQKTPLAKFGVPAESQWSWDDDQYLRFPVHTDDGEVVCMAVSRRSFLQSLSVLGVVPVVVAPSGDGLRGDPVGYFTALRAALADSDNAGGPGRVLMVAVEAVAQVRAARLAARGSVAIDLVQVETQFADLVGWLHQDSGDFLAAGYWLDRALELSLLSPERETTAFVLTRKAQLAAERGDAVSAVDHAQAAISLTGPGHRFAALARTWEGQAFALQGRAAQSQDAFNHADDILDNCTQKSTDSPWAQFFDLAYVQIHRSGSDSLLGQYDRAISGFSAGINRLGSGFHRDKGVYLARQASAYAGAGDSRRAERCLGQAANIGQETGSARIAAILQKHRHKYPKAGS